MAPKLRTSSFSVLDAIARPTSSPAARTFTSTGCCEKMTKARYDMVQWLKGRDGSQLAEPAGRPNYIGPLEDQPFPNNPLFRSQSVLDDFTRELIWKKIMQRGESIKAVSAEIGVDVRRVAAVVRLKEVQRQWEAQGKRLATPYAKAVQKMLPKTVYVEGGENVPHEPINEIHVHKLTMQQLFVPVSESRQFTREDAAKAFHEKMLSADKRSQQPELIKMEREVLQSNGAVSREARLDEWKEEMQKQEVKIAEALAKKDAEEAKKTTKVKTDRFEFRFKEISADDVGVDGKSRQGTGWRYGVPHEDRKRGQVKIPTSVP
ncbi:hypothetical protein NLU13_0109 [Sarocladium strictum]|uniref:Ribosomal protein S35, mitochondrial n=1 Tax=Sarocladium strictum TaxID=5046 RepID=A0AA39LB50_SARSR|nr:hypothetical protein NLU13_0109 [Sarocladium strictum]